MDKQVFVPFGSTYEPSERSRGFVCIVANTLRVHYSGGSGTERAGDDGEVDARWEGKRCEP